MLDEGQDLPTLPPWYVRENKWRSARYGLNATIITDRDGTQRQVTDDIRDLVVSLAPIAERLGCADELASIPAIVASGGSSTRQQATAADNDGDLTAVVRSLIDELRVGSAPR